MLVFYIMNEEKNKSYAQALLSCCTAASTTREDIFPLKEFRLGTDLSHKSPLQTTGIFMGSIMIIMQRNTIPIL